MKKPAAHLLVIGEREALAWILTEQRMAFAPNRTAEAMALGPDDLLLLYTTRGCFHNPTRDRGRVIGEARLASAVERLEEPIRFGAREFPTGCRLVLDVLSPLGNGVELAPLVPRLGAFPDSTSWAVRMRRSLVALDSKDAALIRKNLAKVDAANRRAAIASYVAAVPVG